MSLLNGNIWNRARGQQAASDWSTRSEGRRDVLAEMPRQEAKRRAMEDWRPVTVPKFVFALLITVSVCCGMVQPCFAAAAVNCRRINTTQYDFASDGGVILSGTIISRKNIILVSEEGPTKSVRRADDGFIYANSYIKIVKIIRITERLSKLYNVGGIIPVAEIVPCSQCYLTNAVQFFPRFGQVASKATFAMQDIETIRADADNGGTMNIIAFLKQRKFIFQGIMGPYCYTN
jgi:hypothetical protein